MTKNNKYNKIEYKNNQKKFYIQTFGCQMNEYDSERLIGNLENKGWEKVYEYKDADLVILNTCSIREKATHKIYSEIGRINIEYTTNDGDIGISLHSLCIFMVG